MSSVSELPRCRSPLLECEHDDPIAFGDLNRVHLSELAGLQYWNIRFDLADNSARDRVSEHLGVTPPSRTNDVSASDNLSILGLGPDECLVIDSSGDEGRLAAADLKNAVDSVVDVTGGYTMIVVAGPDAADILSGGCTLDFHESVFPVGACAQSLIAQANVIIWHYNEISTYRLVVRRTFAEYLWLWLVDASQSCLYPLE